MWNVMSHILFKSEQPFHLVGHSLSNYRPWETTNIGKDGNCLFRCLSHIITGNQESHREVRQLIAHYIASEGLHKIGWYLKQCNYTPCQYFLTEKLTHVEGVWEGDVEIIAASEILKVDIFVANNDYRWGIEAKFHNDVRWHLLWANTSNTAAIYIKNYADHFEPVISMLNSNEPTFGSQIAPIAID